MKKIDEYEIENFIENGKMKELLIEYQLNVLPTFKDNRTFYLINEIINDHLKKPNELHLEPRICLVWLLHYIFNFSLSEIAHYFNITNERTRQLLARANKHMNDYWSWKLKWNLF